MTLTITTEKKDIVQMVHDLIDLVSLPEEERQGTDYEEDLQNILHELPELLPILLK
jgi:hypothetical protein